MRTTLTLDDDVAVELERRKAADKRSMKAVVNDALRLGLQAMASPPRTDEPFRTRVLSTRCRLPNIDNIAEVLAIAEGENHK